MSIQVSVAICTRNRCESLRLALELLSKSRVPEHFQWEVLVVDNGSSDATAETIASFTSCLPIRRIAEPKSGLAIARNTALRAACGEVIAFTDDDCFVDEEWLASIWAEFRDDPRLAGIGGRVELFDQRDYPITVRTQREREQFSVKGGLFSLVGGNMAFARWAMDRIGSFDVRFGAGAPLNSGEDIDYLYRLLSKNLKVVYVPGVLVYHNHGRRTPQHVQALMRAYDIGRGGLYAKYVLRGDTMMLRQAYWYVRGMILGSIGQLWDLKRVIKTARTLAHVAWGAIRFAAIQAQAPTLNRAVGEIRVGRWVRGDLAPGGEGGTGD